MALDKFLLKQSLGDWKVGKYTDEPSEHLVAINSTTHEKYFLYPQKQNDEVKDIIAHYQNPHAQSAGNRVEAEEKLRGLPEKVKDALLVSSAPSAQTAVAEFFGKQHLKGSCMVVTEGDNWLIRPEYATFTDGNVCYVPCAIKLAPYGTGHEKHWLCFAPKDGVADRPRLYTQTGAELESLPPPVRKALADLFCEWADRYTIPYAEHFYDKACGTYQETSDVIERIEKASADANFIPSKPPNMPSVPPSGNLDISEALALKGWQLHSGLTLSDEKPGSAFRPTAINTATGERYTFKNFAMSQGTVDGVVIEYQHPQDDEPTTIGSQEFLKVPHPVRREMIAQYEYWAGKSNARLPAEVRNELNQTVEQVALQIHRSSPSWEKQMMDFLKGKDDQGRGL